MGKLLQSHVLGTVLRQKVTHRLRRSRILGRDCRLQHIPSVAGFLLSLPVGQGESQSQLRVVFHLERKTRLEPAVRQTAA